MMMISDHDARHHQAPPGWSFVGQDPEYLLEYEATLWFLERVW